MNIDVSREQDLVVLKTEGRIDATTCGQLDAAIAEVFDGGDSRFVIDMTGVEYISSAGLGVLLKGAKRARGAGGKIALSGLQESVTDVFEVSGFLTLFTVHASAGEAAGSLKDSGGSAC